MRTLTVILVLLLAGCTQGQADPLASDGPLQLEVVPGKVGIDAPAGGGPWRATFGGLLPCAETDDVLISRIEYRGRRNDQPIESAWRHVTAKQARDGAMPIQSAGEESMARLTRPSDFEAVNGARVVTPCPRPDFRSEGFDELFVMMDVDDRGNEISGLRVHYTSNGADYVEDVPWGMQACGRKATDDFCSQPQ